MAAQIKLHMRIVRVPSIREGRFFWFLYISVVSFHAVLPCWLDSIKLAQLQKLLKLTERQYQYSPVKLYLKSAIPSADFSVSLVRMQVFPIVPLITGTGGLFLNLTSLGD